MLFQQLFNGSGGFFGTSDPIQNLLTTPSSSQVPHMTSIPTIQAMGNGTCTPTSQTMTNHTSVPTCPPNGGGSSRQTSLLRARNSPVTPSLATRMAFSRPPQPALNKDGMSGNKLTHVGVPKFPPVVTDNCNLDIDDLGIGKGRKITKTTTPKPRINDRPEIKPLPLQKNFDNRDAAKDISALLRVHYRGDFYWDEVSAETRDLLWEQFGMRYCWDKKLELGILEVWESLNRLYFTRMLQKAKANHKAKTRAKWLFPKYYRRLVKHWRSEKHVRIATRNSRNRRGSHDTGVKAPPTYFGGSIGMMGYQRLVNAEAQNQ